MKVHLFGPHYVLLVRQDLQAIQLCYTREIYCDGVISFNLIALTLPAEQKLSRIFNSFSL